MKVGAVRSAARQWALDHVARMPAVRGVFFSGSIATRSDQEEFSAVSDVDIDFVVDDSCISEYQQRKIQFGGFLIDEGFQALSRFIDVATILRSPWYADHLAPDGIIYDPSGFLGRIQRAVTTECRNRSWVLARCDSLRQEIIGSAEAVLREQARLLDRVFSFVWMSFYIAVLPAVALLWHPSLRKAVLQLREICETHGALGFYRSYLELIGSTDVVGPQFERHVRAYEGAFDYAMQLEPTEFPLDFNIAAESRAYMVDGVKEFVELGRPAEGVLFLLGAWSLALNRVESGPQTFAAAAIRRQYDHFLDDLGLAGPSLGCKGRMGGTLLPEALNLARALIETNRGIVT